MANHYVKVLAGLGEHIEIPAPAIDMTSNTSHFGSSGTFVSGGGYVRKSRFGAQTLGVSWNNLSTDDIIRLRTVAESGSFTFDNPMAHRNAVVPWLANHTYLDDLLPNVFGYASRSYTLARFDRMSDPETATLPGSYLGYPGIWATRYEVGGTGHTLLYPIVIPDGYVARAWVVGEVTGSVAVNFANAEIPINTPTDHNTGYPTIYEDITPVSGFSPSIMISGAGTLTLQSIQLRVVPEGAPEELLTYSPGLGNSGVEFTEEGLQIVQHSAALDMQSAAATWMETGWWS